MRGSGKALALLFITTSASCTVGFHTPLPTYKKIGYITLNSKSKVSLSSSTNDDDKFSIYSDPSSSTDKEQSMKRASPASFKVNSFPSQQSSFQPTSTPRTIPVPPLSMYNGYYSTKNYVNKDEKSTRINNPEEKIIELDATSNNGSSADYSYQAKVSANRSYNSNNWNDNVNGNKNKEVNSNINNHNNNWNNKVNKNTSNNWNADINSNTKSKVNGNLYNDWNADINSNRKDWNSNINSSTKSKVNDNMNNDWNTNINGNNRSKVNGNMNNNWNSNINGKSRSKVNGYMDNNWNDRTSKEQENKNDALGTEEVVSSTIAEAILSFNANATKTYLSTRISLREARVRNQKRANWSADEVEKARQIVERIQRRAEERIRQTEQALEKKLEIIQTDLDNEVRYTNFLPPPPQKLRFLLLNLISFTLNVSI